MAQLLDDIRISLRRLWHQPGFTVVAVATLAVGLGANTAVFTLIHALMLRTLPVERPQELYRLGDNNNCCNNSGLQSNGFSLYSYRLFEHLRDATTSDFTDLAGFQANTLTMSLRAGATDGAQSLPVQFVTGNYFQTLGVAPATGRLLGPDDDRRDAAPVIVISHQTWATRFALDPGVVGRSAVVNGVAMTIAGVTPPEFFGDTIRPNPPGFWIPVGQEPALRGSASVLDRGEQHWMYAIGRARAGADATAIGARSTAALQQWLSAQTFYSDQDRRNFPNQRITVVPASGGVSLMARQFGQPLNVLFVMSALLLLIASANLANLLLARADRGQAAIRAALGATAGRLMRLALVEGLIVSLAGGIAGLGVATLGTRALIGLAFPGGVYVPVDAGPSAAVLLFAFGLAILTGAVFAAAPALAMSRTPPLEALSGVGRSSHQRSFVPRRSLVMTQVALSFILLAGAGLLARSLGALESQRLGFDPADRLVVRVDPPAIAGEIDKLGQLFGRAREELSRVPGVLDVSYAMYSPMEGNNWSSGISIGGRESDPAQPDSSSWNRVGPRYFETVGTPLLRGRLLDERDTSTSRRVVVVNDAFRRRFFESSDPIGRTVGLGDRSHAADYEIVGVVDDVKYTDPRNPVRPMFFIPAFQRVEYAGPGDNSVQNRSMLMRVMLLRTATGSGAREDAIRRALAAASPDLSVARIMTLTDQVSGNFRLERLMSRLTTVYGALALALAALGLYGVTAYGVAQRTREIGIRMALGADRGRIMRTVIGGPVIHTLLGLAIAIPIALFAGKAIAGQLYGVDGQDPVIYAIASVVLLASAILAAVVPALRAAAITPTRALRE